MKRTNVILDEKLLEEARVASGEKTYSATIMKALAEMVRVKRVGRFLDRIGVIGDNAFAPGYIEWYERQHPGVVWPKRVEKRKKAVSANERRVPAEKKAQRRGSR